jgi:hypothetical protein|tara:strand:+ start:198 stop:404 length:207 start_codon:yes stop_codon:yes gene_type:complete
MKWIEEHQKECKILDSDKCNECFHISEAQWALTEAHEEIQAKKNQPKPKVETKLDWDYKLREWREVIK